MKKKYFLYFLSVCFILISCSGVVYRNTMYKYYSTKTSINWQKSSNPDFILYYKEDSKTEKNLLLSIKKIQSGIDKAKKFTNVNIIKTPIHYFVVDDREQFANLTKLNYTGISYIKSNTIIESYFLLGQSHEVVHLITLQKWGNTQTWIREGLAVYSDDNWNGKSLEKTCLDLYQKRQLIPIKNIIKGFKKYNTQISYPQSGMLVKYLVNRYGWDKFYHFWKKPNLEKIYGVTDSELEQQWIKYIIKQTIL